MQDLRQIIPLILIALFYTFELIAPLNKRSWDKKMLKHGFTNVMIIIIATLVVKLFLFGIAYTNFDAFSFKYSFIRLTGLSGTLATVICLLVFDFAIWFQHLVFHRFPMLWNLHKVHHADPFLDTTSGLRFHPIEILLSMIVKLCVVTLLGISKNDFTLFEIILSGFALFNHSNFRLPLFLENFLKFIIVTQRVHQVHHSNKESEMHSNFGFNLVIWDRLFKTYKDYNNLEDGFKMGLKGLRENDANSLWFMLKWPLSSNK